MLEATNIIFLTLTAVTLAALVWQNHKHQTKVMSALNDRLLLLETAITKIGTETTALVAEVALLREQLANAQVPADALETLTRIEARVKAVDDQVPDAAAPPPTEGQ